MFLNDFVPDYKTYTALVAVLGLVVFAVSPWFIVWPGFQVVSIAIVSGALFIFALLTFFYSLQIGEVSRVIPFIGGLVPVFSLLLSIVFIGRVFSYEESLAFILLVAGSVLITRMPHKTHWWSHVLDKMRNKRHTYGIWVAVLSSFLFAVSFVLSKIVYEEADFWNGFLWIRLGGLIPIVTLLANEDVRDSFKSILLKLKSKKGALFLMNQGFGATGFIMQNFAISIGSVALINALQGVQFVFVIFLALIASVFFSSMRSSENMSLRMVAEKILAVFIVGAGLWVLAFAGL